MTWNTQTHILVARLHYESVSVTVPEQSGSLVWDTACVVTVVLTAVRVPGRRGSGIGVRRLLRRLGV